MSDESSTTYEEYVCQRITQLEAENATLQQIATMAKQLIEDREGGYDALASDSLNQLCKLIDALEASDDE